MRLRRQMAVVLSTALMLVGVSAVSATAAGPASPVVAVDLMADNGDGITGFKAGEVQVWNDTDTLYVKYLITAADWCLMGSHLAVEEFLSDIPQNKSNNPKVGNFEFSETHDCLTVYTYSMPIPSYDPAIAAHADLRGLGNETTLTRSSGSSGLIAGPIAGYAAPGDGAWPAFVSATAPWEHSAWAGVTAAMAPAEWMSTAYWVENPDIDSWRWVRGTFDIPGEPTSGHTVSATADNEEEFWVNGVMVGSNANWPTISDYSSVFSPVSGTNTYDFVFKNWAWSGGVTANPTGLIYSVTVNYRPFIYESGWADGLDFGGKSWATYFNYDVMTWQLLETITVQSRNTAGTGNEVVSSVMTLDNGVGYELKASGTYTFANWGVAGIADAQCSYRIPPHVPAAYYPLDSNGAAWVNGDDLAVGWENYLEVWTNGTAFDWVPTACQSSNEYAGAITGTGGVVNFTIYDSHYSDNRGFITVEIWGYAS